MIFVSSLEDTIDLIGKSGFGTSFGCDISNEASRRSAGASNAAYKPE